MYKNEESANVRSVTSLLKGSVISKGSAFTSENFLNKYETQDTLLSYVEDLRLTPNGIQFSEIFFHNLKSGLKIISSLIEKTDRFKNPYYWVVFSNSAGVKLTLTEGLVQFVKDYQNGLIKPDFDFFDLIQMAQAMQMRK